MSRTRFHTLLLVCSLLFICIWAALLPGMLALDPTITFGNDTSDYHGAALHIVREGFYSMDGIQPMMGREPGYSMFLGTLYFLFGEGNRIAIYGAQAMLYFAASLFFLREFRKLYGERTACIALMMLFLLPPVFYLIFKVYREGIALSFFMLFGALLLSLTRQPSIPKAIGAGTALGAAILTYISFLFLPILLIASGYFMKIRMRYMVIMIAIPIIAVSGWGMRNAAYGDFRIMPIARAADVWTMRATQVTALAPLDPFHCIVSRYFTHQFDRVPANLCRPEGQFAYASWFPACMDEPEGARSCVRKAHAEIFRHFPTFVWQSLFWILEYHFPNVNGWGRIYNLLTAGAEILVYIGCGAFFLTLRKHWQRSSLLFLTIIFYGTSIFALTQSLPRYRMPTLFCYIAISAIGYAALIEQRNTIRSSLSNPHTSAASPR
ncbi:MAG TPA: hypothetical protein VJB82_04250 [Candidatus Peribacterales bacterium]|nr:hypothetical protein [Candidatus Peribacterales bacterium]